MSANTIHPVFDAKLVVAKCGAGRMSRCRMDRGLLAACCVAALLMMGVRSAEAGCGDYLKHAAWARTHLANASLGQRTLAQSTSMPTRETSRPFGDLPCDGPGCERQAPSPVPPAPTLPTSVRNQWALPALSLDTYSAGFAWFTAEAPLLQTSDATSVLERPPRA